MAVFPWQSTVQDQDGNAIASAQLTIRDGGPLGDVSTIFSDSAETPLANPFNATSDGFAQFWAASGTYYIEAESGGQTTDGWYVVLVGAAAGIPVELTATVAAGEAVSMDGALVSEATAAEYLGLAQAGGVATDTINAQSTGNFTLGTWAWTADEYVYLTNAGALTQTPPTGTHRRIGIATTSTVIALSAGPVVVETGGAGSENAIPALDDAGQIDYTMIEKAATGGAGAENLLVQADSSGEIDVSFLGAVADTSRDFTASGTIVAGDAVALSAANTVVVVGETPFTPAIVYEERVDISPQNLLDDFDETFYQRNPITGRIAAIGRDTGNLNVDLAIFEWDDGLGEYTKAVGSPVQVASYSSSRTQILQIDPTSGDILLFVGESATPALQAAIYEDVGGVPTLNTAFTAIDSSVVSNDINGVLCCAMNNAGVGLIFYGETNGTTGYLLPFTYNGTTLSVGTRLSVSNYYQVAGAIRWLPAEEQFLLVYGDQTAGNTKARLITTDGSTVSAPSASTTVLSSASVDTRFACALNQSNDQFLVGYSDASPDFAVYQVSGGSISAVGTIDLLFGATEYVYGACWDAVNGGQWVVLHRGSDSTVRYTRLTQSGSTLTNAGTVTSTGTIFTGSYLSYASEFPQEPFNKSGVITALVGLNSGTGYIVAFQPGTPVTTAVDFIGFAEDGAADTETVRVSTLGKINGQQAGLTINTTYFIDTDGSLVTTDPNIGVGAVGRALSATEIIVTKNTWSA